MHACCVKNMKIQIMLKTLVTFLLKIWIILFIISCLLIWFVCHNCLYIGLSFNIGLLLSIINIKILGSSVLYIFLSKKKILNIILMLVISIMLLFLCAVEMSQFGKINLIFFLFGVSSIILVALGIAFNKTLL